MSKHNEQQKVKELKEMLNEKNPQEPVEKVLAKFCERHGVSLNTCKVYYNRLVESGEVKKEQV